MGFRIETSLGNNGEFIYPNSNYVARVLSMNPRTLENTFGMYKEKIIDLRENPNLERIETVGNDNQILYSHELKLKSVGVIDYAFK